MTKLKNIRLIKSKKGWFVEIDDGVIKDRWAFTALELWLLAKVIKDRSDELLKDINNDTTNHNN